jgi:hypothetical protein
MAMIPILNLATPRLSPVLGNLRANLALGQSAAQLAGFLIQINANCATFAGAGAYQTPRCAFAVRR